MFDRLFFVTKKSLDALNLFYVFLSLSLFGTAKYMEMKTPIPNLLPSLPEDFNFHAKNILVLGLIGLLGTKIRDPFLFVIYLVTLSHMFLAQYFLAPDFDSQQKVAQIAWSNASYEDRFETQEYLVCCGFESNDTKSVFLCPYVDCCTVDDCDDCADCETTLTNLIGNSFTALELFAIFFVFTEFIAVLLSCKFLMSYTKNFRTVRPPTETDLKEVHVDNRSWLARCLAGCRKHMDPFSN